eukprot:SAG31_NODE_5584_length_2442_cov_3.322663_3_plen_130_part_00
MYEFGLFHVLQVAEGNSMWWQYAKPGHYNDPDDVALGFVFGKDQSDPWNVLGPTVSETEAKLYLGLWALMKAPFILSIDFARNAPVSRASRAWPQWILPLISNPHLIAISQDPLGCARRRKVNPNTLFR